MNASRYSVLVLLLPLLVCSWISVALSNPVLRPGQANQLLIATIFGTLFGQVTLAAAWTALGPLPLLWRLPLSLAWIAALAIAFMLHVMLHLVGPPVQQIALVVAACLAGQWLLVQASMWCLAEACDLRLRYRSDAPPTGRDRQFGIRQVMILTAIVALVLGAGRWLVAETADALARPDWSGIAGVAFLALAGIFMTLPLLLAALLPRLAAVAVAAVLLLMAAGTWFEMQLILIVRGPGGGLNLWLLAWINGVQAAWILAVVGILRLCGYSIQQPRSNSPPAGPTADKQQPEPSGAI